MENDKITKKNLICYPIGTIGRDALYALINSYLLTFVLFTHTLDAAQLAAITGIMIAARVFDALNDPIMGNIIERTRSKYGKFKPWLVAGALSTSVVIYLMFNIQLQGWNFVWFFGVMYFAFSITYTMNDISYWGMIPALGSDADTRNQFTSRATLCAGIGGTLAAMLIPMLTTGAGAIGGSTTTAYGWVAVGIAVAAPLFLLFTVFGVREHREAAPANRPKEKFSLIQVFKTIARNDQLVWVAVIFLIQQVGNGLVIGGLGSTYIYFTFGYSGGLYSLFNTVGMMATAFLMIFYPAISRKLSRKKLMGYMVVLSTAGYALMLASATYLIFGVTGYTNQISDLEQRCAQGLLSEEEKLSAIEQVLFGGGGVSGGQSMGLLVTMTVLPWVLMLISYFLYKKKYKLDEAEYDRICRELGKK